MMKKVLLIVLSVLFAFCGCKSNKHMSNELLSSESDSNAVSIDQSSISEENSIAEIIGPNTGVNPNSMLGEFSFVNAAQTETSITFFSQEQIYGFRTRQENGQQYSLTKEELNYIVKDTIKAFEKYDIIYIRDIDGKLHKYYGLRFYSSQAYLDSFGGFELGVTDATFDYRRDLFDVLFMRLSVFSSAVQEGLEPGGIIFSDTDHLSESELEQLASAFETVYTRLRPKKQAALFAQRIPVSSTMESNMKGCK